MGLDALSGLSGLSGMVGGGGSPPGGGTPVALGLAGTGAFSALTGYPFTEGTGWGTEYTDPATVPASAVNGVAFSPDGTVVLVAIEATPFIQAYHWTGTGFGTKYADPGTVSGSANQGYCVAWHPSGNYVAVGLQSDTTANYQGLWVYNWSNSTGFGSPIANTSGQTPYTADGDHATRVEQVLWSPTGDYLMCGTGPYGDGDIMAWTWSGGTYSAANGYISAIGGCLSLGVTWGLNESYVALYATVEGTPAVFTYAWNSPGFGGNISYSAYTGPSATQSISLDPTGQYLAVPSSAHVRVYPVSSSGTLGTYVSAADATNASYIKCCWSSDSTTLFVSSVGSPQLTAWPWTGTAFGAKYTAPSAPATNAWSVSVQNGQIYG